MPARTAVATAMCLIVPIGSHAATYNPGTLAFSTETRQSVWEPGDATEIAGTYFAGTTWNAGTPALGAIVGERPKRVRNTASMEIWQACDSIAKAFGSNCAFPKPPEFVMTPDTRTGVEASIQTFGKAGFNLNYELTAGSFGASVDYGVSALLPDKVKKGETFQIATNAVFASGEIDVKSPNITASIDAVLQANATARATGCFVFAGCSTSAGTLFSTNINSELLSVDPNRITYLGGLLPEGVSLTTPLLNQTATLKAGIVNGVPTVYAEGTLIPDIGATGGIDLGSVEVFAPIFAKTGGKVGESLSVEARAEFIKLFADLDGILPVPPGGASFSVGPLSISGDIYDFDAGPTLDVFQDLKLTPKLKVRLDMSQLVAIGGEMVDSFTGYWDDLPGMKVFKKTTFVPEFFVEALLTSSTGLQAGLKFSMEFLKASVSLGPALNLAIGPLYKELFPFTPDWAKFAVYENTFAVDAFRSVNTQPFTIAPVPLPAAVWMLLGALGGLGLLRRLQAVRRVTFGGAPAV